jgi:hypothetical protein
LRLSEIFDTLSGPIDISQVLAMTPGEHAQMSFSVADEDIFAPNLTTSPDEKLDFMFGGQDVKELTLDDFKGAHGVIEYNDFHTFTTNVADGADDTLRIRGNQGQGQQEGSHSGQRRN